MNTKQELRLPDRNSIESERHPLLTRRYTLITPMIESLNSEIVQWIKNGVTGGIIEGDPRLGKTKCRRFVGFALSRHFPRLPVYSMIGRLYAHPSERVFFGDLLKAFRHSMYAEGSAAQRRDRLIEGVGGLVQSSGQEKIVLLIDQAHRLQEMHYDWLVDFHDELSERGIELFVFLFGQRELTSIRDELRRAGKTQIIGRFMVDRLEYHGIRSLSEMKACLSCYDEHARFPEDTDWTFTRYFLPDAFAKGWRLSQHAAAFWKAFEDVRRHGVMHGPMEIPMQHFVRTVERFLTEFRTEGSSPIVSHTQLVQFVAATIFAAIPRDGQFRDEDEDEEADK